MLYHIFPSSFISFYFDLRIKIGTALRLRISEINPCVSSEELTRGGELFCRQAQETAEPCRGPTFVLGISATPPVGRGMKAGLPAVHVPSK